MILLSYIIFQLYTIFNQVDILNQIINQISYVLIIAISDYDKFNLLLLILPSIWAFLFIYFIYCWIMKYVKFIHSITNHSVD